MQVWNVLHAACWKCRNQKIVKNSLSGHHCTTLSGYVFATKARIDSWKKLVKQQCLPHVSSQYGELRPTSGWDLLASLGHPGTFQRISDLGSVTAWHASSGHQPNFAALNRGRHLYSAGRPSRWHWPTLQFYLSFFPSLISAIADRMYTVLAYMVWL